MSHESSGIQFGISALGEVLVGEKLSGNDWFLEAGKLENGETVFAQIKIHRSGELNNSLEEIVWMGERAPRLLEVRDEIEARWIAFKTGVELDLGVTFGAFECADGVHQETPSIFGGLFGGTQ